jgi:hypothetical protein
MVLRRPQNYIISFALKPGVNSEGSLSLALVATHSGAWTSVRIPKGYFLFRLRKFQIMYETIKETSPINAAGPKCFSNQNSCNGPCGGLTSKPSGTYKDPNDNTLTEYISCEENAFSKIYLRGCLA